PEAPSTDDRYIVSADAGSSFEDAVLSKALATPSGLTPSPGDAYIIASEANSTSLPPVDAAKTDSAEASAVHGSRYLINGAGQNDWLGHDFEIAEYNGVGVPGWLFYTPQDGDVVLNSDDGKTYQFSQSSGAWTENAWGGKAGKV